MIISTFLQRHTTESKINILMDLAKRKNYLKINSLDSVKRYLKNLLECYNTDNYHVFICQEHWGFQRHLIQITLS